MYFHNMARDFFFHTLTIYHSKTTEVFMWKQANLANFLVKVPVKTVTFDSLDQFFLIFSENDHLSILETMAKTSNHDFFLNQL